MSSLILWDKMKQAVVECHNIDEISNIRNQAEAYRYALRQAKESPEVIKKAEEIKLRAERRAGELLKETARKPEEGRPVEVSNGTTLTDMGISRDQSSKWQKIASIPEEKFENYIEVEKELSTAGVLRAGKNVHISNNSGENEWYTPIEYIVSAKKVMGDIDLDPASSETANIIVRAKEYYTKEDDGLKQEWGGRDWLNPPYSQPEISMFAKAVLEQDFSEIIILVNNATETDWFYTMYQKCNAVCFVRKRIKFLDKDGFPSGSPLQGQALLYSGDKRVEFVNEFKRFGICLFPAEAQ